MDPTGLVVLIGVLAVLTVGGLVARRRAGRVRRSTPVPASGSPAGSGPSDAAGPGWELAGVSPDGRRALLLQLSSPVCTPCRQTAALLSGMAEQDRGLAHVDIDVAQRVDVARALGVMRTPTTVVFDAAGTELARVSGVPRAGELEAVLPPPRP